MSFRNCCVPGCSSRANDSPMHCFPNPENDIDRFRSWIMNIGGDIIRLRDNFIYKNRRVCHKHFIEKWHYTKNRLCPLAIPTLHLAESAPFPRLEIPTEEEITVPSTSVENQISEREISIVCNTTPATRSVPTQTPKAKMTLGELKMRQTIKKLNRDVSSTTKSKKKYIERLKIAKDSMKNLKVLTNKLSKSAAAFVKMQITQAGKNKKGRRFTLRQKILALSLYKSSPKAYRLLSEICILPKRSTLYSLMQKVSLKPGINNKMLENLKKRVDKMPNSHKYCAVLFDEMAIAPHIDMAEEKIIGFVDDGETRKPELADHVLVFMARGVIKKYKQPVQFNFCAGTTKTINLKKYIINVIQKMQSCGLKVVATICDQGATNVAAINALLRDTKEMYLRKGEEYPEGQLIIGGKKIYPLYDPPHLIKGIRNNLLNKDLIYVLDGKKCVAKWNHVIKLHQKGPGFEGVRMAPKLTLHHVMPRLIPKMKVKLCTQVLSSTVAVALGLSADLGLQPEEVKETARLFFIFDNLFDSVNGSFSAPLEGKKYRAAVTPTSPHHKLWRESLDILKTMKYVDKNGKESIVPSLSSWIKTIRGFKLLCAHMYKLNERSLLLRHFNQDPLENFFGAIRAHGHSNIMPNAAAFQAAYKTLLINNLSSAHSVGANCEKDGGICLQNLRYFFTTEDSAVPKISEHEINGDHFNICVDVDALLKSNLPQDVEKCAAAGYCSGWLIRAARKKIYKNCVTCTGQLESKDEKDFHKLIKLSEYSDKTWLCYPSKNVFDIFVHIEVVVMEIMKSMSYEENVLSYIKLIVATIVNFGFITCVEHKNVLTEYIIKKNVSFCINNWCKEVNKILTGKSVNTNERDPIKKAAQNYYIKNKKNKRQRATGVSLSV